MHARESCAGRGEVARGGAFVRPDFPLRVPLSRAWIQNKREKERAAGFRTREGNREGSWLPVPAILAGGSLLSNPAVPAPSSPIDLHLPLLQSIRADSLNSRTQVLLVFDVPTSASLPPPLARVASQGPLPLLFLPSAQLLLLS